MHRSKCDLFSHAGYHECCRRTRLLARCISNANPILEMKRKFIFCACVFFQDFQLCVFCQDIWEYDRSRHTAGLNVHQRDLSFHWSTQLWHLITVSIINCRIWNSWKIHHISHFILATIWSNITWEIVWPNYFFLRSFWREMSVPWWSHDMTSWSLTLKEAFLAKRFYTTLSSKYGNWFKEKKHWGSGVNVVTLK